MRDETRPVQVLIAYDPRVRAVVELAESIAGGVVRGGGRPALRAVPGIPADELLAADAVILGSPNWTGPSALVKHWLDGLGDIWEQGLLGGRVGAAFACADAPAAGLEFTLWSLLHWLLANGMVVVGLPWSEAMLRSGSYYGATAVGAVSEADRQQAALLGRRVAAVAGRLRSHRSTVEGGDGRCPRRI